MNVIISNLIFLVLLPTLVVAGVFALLQRLSVEFLSNTTSSTRRVALIAVGIGVYFLGHSFYPLLVPLIKASTPWLHAIGGIYSVIGLAALGLADRQHSALGVWLVAMGAFIFGVLTAGGPDIIGEIISQRTIIPALLLSLPLSAMFPFGYESEVSDVRLVRKSMILVYGLYALILVNSITIAETVRGPAALVFIGFGCIGALLGLPLHVLGSMIAVED